MAEPFLKVTDVKSLKELAQVLTYPVIAVAYFLQSGPGIGWDGSWHWGIPDHANAVGQVFFFFLYFVLKAIWVCSFVDVVDILIMQSGWEYTELVLMILSVALIGMGVMGLFAHNAFPQLALLNKFWYFAFLVWGFSCSGRLDRVRS